jgi:hypothetical protein
VNQDLAAAHAAVSGILVENKKQAIQATHGLRRAHGEAASEEAENAALEKEFARVDADEQRPMARPFSCRSTPRISAAP